MMITVIIDFDVIKLNDLKMSNYFRVKEPSFVTLRKLEVLESIATEKSSKDIIDEIR